ncbi:MAG: methyltransferase domain-containing protein [Minisyncoccota bacterium]
MKFPHPLGRLIALISEHSRQKKYQQFLSFFQPNEQTTIVDIGVNTTEYSSVDNFLEKHYPYPRNITAVSQNDPTFFQQRYPEIAIIQADGRFLPFPENHFDIAYSNAVIEHVGTRSDQILFLQELWRVSKAGYLTTPNRHFPIEVHTRIPILHLILPKKYFEIFLCFIGKKWATNGYMELLSEHDIRTLLNQMDLHDYMLIKNRFFGYPMTFTLLWKKN